jgi:tetratricopeptide (TPR) repeat protein
VSGYRVLALDALETVGGRLPIRRELGIRAFGINAWTAREAGEPVIVDHDEVPSGHEELYLVLSGRARFTLDGEELDAPPGTFVAVKDPAVRRRAVAEEPGTTILAIGAPPGEPFAPRAWEDNAEIFPLFDQGDFAGAKAKILEALERNPGAGGLLYNLACAEAQLGEREAALGQLHEAIAAFDGFRESAAEDEDLAPLRDDTGFPR